MSKFILIVLIGVVLIAIAVRDPAAVGHLVQGIIMLIAKLLSAIGTLLSNLVGGKSH